MDQGARASASGIALEPSEAGRKIWRLRLFAKELVAAGFFPEMLDPWPLMKKLLLAKGLPEGFTLDRTPVRIRPFEQSEHGPGIELEFE